MNRLVRLYPSRWRSAYGDELADLLMGRWLGIGAVVNVVANAAWQQLRMGEPWVIVGVPLFVWSAAAGISLLLFPGTRVNGPPIGGFPGGLAVSLLVGFWTSRRCRTGGGRAVLKMALLLISPVVLIEVLAALGIVHAIAEPGIEETQSSGILLRRLWFNLNSLCAVGAVGWLGGRLGRLRRSRA